MKKLNVINALILAWILLFVTGCSNLGDNNDQIVTTEIAATTDTTDTTEATETVEANPISNKKVDFSTFTINEKYYNEANGYVELVLQLPQLDGNYEGIPIINAYFAEKEKFFYDELPLAILKEENIKVEGQSDNWYRSADYKLETVMGDIISISAKLDGGAGGVGWGGIEGNTFDLNTGQKLGLPDLFKVNEVTYMTFIYDFVSAEITKKLNDSLKESTGSGFNFEDAYSGDGYESIRTLSTSDFYLTEKALVVFYPKYALAAGAAGPMIFEIPFESISDMLSIE